MLNVNGDNGLNGVPAPKAVDRVQDKDPEVGVVLIVLNQKQNRKKTFVWSTNVPSIVNGHNGVNGQVAVKAAEPAQEAGSAKLKRMPNMEELLAWTKRNPKKKWKNVLLIPVPFMVHGDNGVVLVIAMPLVDQVSSPGLDSVISPNQKMGALSVRVPIWK